MEIESSGNDGWRDAGPASLAPGGVERRDAGGAAVLIVRDEQGGWHAVAALCTHAALPLDAARVRGAALLCPHHGARFDLASGRAIGPPASEGLRIWPVRAADGRIEVRL